MRSDNKIKNEDQKDRKDKNTAGKRGGGNQNWDKGQEGSRKGNQNWDDEQENGRNPLDGNEFAKY